MSFGVVSSESGATTLSELLDQADKALYASKEGGRDRVTRWDAIAAG
jgi:PleD family two-component response regulator